MAALVWKWQNGTASDDSFNAAAMGSDGSSLLAGYTNRNATAVTMYWTAIKLDADGTMVWEWQDEIKGEENDLLYGAAMGLDGSVVLAGSADDDFQVIKLDADGNFMWRFEGGTTEGREYGDGIAMGDDGSVVVVGGTGGAWNGTNKGDWDFAAFKLDANGTLLWKWQDGTAQLDLTQFLVMADDGSVAIAGYSSGEFTGDNTTASDVSSLSSDELEPNFVAIKLDSEGAEVWRWQDGPRGEENGMRSVCVTDDGSFILAGLAEGVWSGQSSAGGLDFVAVKLDADGKELWRWQDGTTGDDNLYAVTVQADGTIVLGGSTEGAWNGSNEGGNDFAMVALNPDGEEVWRWQGGSPASLYLSGGDYIFAMSAGSDEKIVFAGTTYGSWEGTNHGGGDLVAAMLDTSPLATPVPTTAPPSAAPPSPTAAPPSAAPPSSTAAPPSAAPPSATTPPPSSPPSSTTAPLGVGTENVTPIIAGAVSAVAGLILIALGCILWKRHVSSNDHASKTSPAPAVVLGTGNTPAPTRHNLPPPIPPPSYAQAVATAEGVEGGGNADQPFPPAFARGMPPTIMPTARDSQYDGARGDYLVQQRVYKETANAPNYGGGVDGGDGRGGGGGGGDWRGGVAGGEAYMEPTTQAGNNGGGGGGGGGGFGVEQADAVDGFLQRDLTETISTVNISTAERDELASDYKRGAVAGEACVADKVEPALDEIGDASSNRRRVSYDGLRLGEAVGDAAQELARNCHIPGVSEAAAAVSILATLVMGTRDSKTGTEASLRRCRSIVLMLKRAAKVLGKGGDTTGKAECAMMEDVHDAIFDLVELIKTYQSKNKLSQVMMSTLFRKRQDEMGAVVDRAILGLQLGLHVQVGNDVSAVKEDVGAFKDGMHLYQGSIEEAQSKYLAEARKTRRQRKLNEIEIPEDHVAITEELLGKGGFGEVFLADYNGRNAAAKVLYITHELSRMGENDVLDGTTSGQLKQRRQKDQRKAFLRELDAMTRLRSPYTVNVYGAVTCLPDRLVLVMELLAGGDLRTLLSTCEHPLAQQQSLQILGDICAGMVFLHSKEAIHGDVKSANVLLNGAGRAKIGDFGTSRWTHHTMSTGLATFTTKASKNTQMSLAWSAPEVLHAAGSTYASDVYSFGIVVWEVLSRELPWETVTHPRDIYIRVVLNDLRPTIPDDAPAEIADVAKACWVSEPGDRPTFSAIMEGMKANGWKE